MKQVKNIILVLLLTFVTNVSYGQMAAVKKFDYSILKDKVLYIPSYETSEKFIAKMTKRGKFDKITEAKAKVELYNTAWKEAMAESSYDATDYEIRGFSAKKLFKSKDPKAVIMQFVSGELLMRLLN